MNMIVTSKALKRQQLCSNAAGQYRTEMWRP